MVRNRFRRGIAAYLFFAGAMVRGTKAGNGGTMAEATDESKAGKASGKTWGKGEHSRLHWMRQWEIETGQRMSTRNRVSTDGAERLRRAADKKVGRNSAKLAEVLTKKALAGDLASARMLLALAEAKKPVPAKKSKGPTLAEWLLLDLKENGEFKGPKEEKEPWREQVEDEEDEDD
jgi:hypothetical protein